MTTVTIDDDAHRMTRPMYWSLRRELWENRSVYLAPLVVAAVVLFASSFSAISLPGRIRNLSTLDPAKRHAAIVRPANMAPAPIMLTTFFVGMFYALDALYGERRDRSVLFWKSLPVSDRTTVLSKITIPLLVLPVVGYALSVVTQIILLLLSTMALIGSGMNPATLWIEVGYFPGLLIMFYGLAVHALWFAPIYGWLMLVSAWSRRTPLLWAVLPLLAVAAVEWLALSSKHFLHLLQYRFVGAMSEAFGGAAKSGQVDRLSQLTPGNFLSAPGLWLGLLFTAAFLALAVWLRRRREPI